LINLQVLISYSEQALYNWLAKLTLIAQHSLLMPNYKFTHYQPDMNLIFCEVAQRIESQWYALEDLLTLELPALIRSLLDTLITK